MYVGKERDSHGCGGRCDLDCDFGNLDHEVVKMIKVNRYWNSDPDSLVERKRPETYDLCKCCEFVNQLVWREKRRERSLWLARAERALTEAERNRTLEIGWKMFRGDYKIAKEYSNLATKWENVERKCRKKAEEYK